MALVALLGYAALALSLYQREEPFGDEAAYLLLAHSLAYDGDVDLRNNIEQADYLPFFHQPQAAAVEPAYDYRGDGTWRSLHNVGLPALIALPYRLAGRLGTSLALAVCAASMSTALFLAAWAVSRDLLASALAAGLVSGTLPVLAYVGKAFTELPAAALLLGALALLLFPGRPGTLRVVLAGLSLAALPWLHVRYTALSLAVLVWALWRVAREAPRPALWPCAAGLTLPLAGSLALMLFLFQRWYGSWLPAAPWGIDLGWPWFDFRLESIYRGAAGMFLDQEYGLFFHAPVYLCALAGLGPLLRKGRPCLALVLAALAVLLLPASVLVLWWGGDSPPARLILPAVPLLGIPLAVALSTWWGARFRVVLLLLALVAVAAGALFCWRPDYFRGEDGDRVAPELRALGWERPAVLFPSLAVHEIRYGAAGLPREAGEILVEAGQPLVFSPAGSAAGARLQQLDLILPRGRSRIACSMRVSPGQGDSSGPLAILRLRDGSGEVLVKRAIVPAELPPEERFQEYAVEFGLERQKQVTFEVLGTGSAALALESTRVGPARRFVDLPQVACWLLAVSGLTWWLNRKGGERPREPIVPCPACPTGGDGGGEKGR